MNSTRRAFIGKLIGTTGGAIFVLASPNEAHACLYGTWHVRCPNCKRIDVVTKGTCQHVCENDKCNTQVFSGDNVTVVCRYGHDNAITTGHPASDSYICPTCKQQGRTVNCNWDK
jgi:hypothetical protein